MFWKLYFDNIVVLGFVPCSYHLKRHGIAFFKNSSEADVFPKERVETRRYGSIEPTIYIRIKSKSVHTSTKQKDKLNTAVDYDIR